MNYRAAAISVIAPLASSAVGIVTALLWSADLPDRIAEQWNNSGVSSTTSVSGIILYLALSGLGIAVFCVVTTARTTSRTGAMASGGGGIALSLFITGSLVGLMATQRGVTDPDTVSGPPMGWIAGAAAVAVVGGLVGALLFGIAVPRTSGQTPRADDPSPAPAGSGSVYVRTIVNWYLVVALGAVGSAFLVVAVLQSSVLTGVIGVIVLLSISLAIWRLLVNEKQVQVFSLAKIASRTVPMQSVLSVERATVRPLRDFGGYGLRSSNTTTSTGVIVTSGDAVNITTSTGHDITITVPRADEAVEAIEAIQRAGTQ